jgi:hypothetical protein
LCIVAVVGGNIDDSTDLCKPAAGSASFDPSAAIAPNAPSACGGSNQSGTAKTVKLGGTCSASRYRTDDFWRAGF